LIRSLAFLSSMAMLPSPFPSPPIGGEGMIAQAVRCRPMTIRWISEVPS